MGVKIQRVKKEDKRFQARATELVYNGHLQADDIFRMLKKQQYGLHSGFVKWHNGNTEDDDDEEVGEHTHVGFIFRQKPKIAYDKLKDFFKVGEVRPKLHEALGKGNSSPKKKLIVYAEYCTNGHDNGSFKDFFHHKFDLELEQCDRDGAILLLLNRGLTFRQIVTEASWKDKAYYMKQKDQIDKMINNWKRFNRDDTVFYKIDSFKQEVVEKLKEWDPTKQTLILKGPSDQGKTELAKALLLHHTKLNPIFCSNINKLKWRDAHQPFILDDMEFKKTNKPQLISVLDLKNQRDIRILFGIHTVEAKTPRILTTNENMEDYINVEHLYKDEIQRRFFYLDITPFGQLY